MLVRPTQPVEIFGNVSFGTLAIRGRPRKILRRIPLPEELNTTGVAKYSNFSTYRRLYLRNGARQEVS